MSPLIRNLAFAFGLALILWFGYTLFIQQSDELVTSNGVGTSDAALAGQSFFVELQKIQAVNLHGEVLNDARFQSLVDLRQDVVPEPVGRKNPFLPVTTH